MQRLRIGAGVRACHKRLHFELVRDLNGGDDEARTRDLCRDRAAL